MSRIADLVGAVQAGDVTRVRELLATDPTLAGAKDAEGATPAHYAALNGHREIVRLLRDAGADINARDDRHHATPAGWAIEYLRELGGLLGIEIEDMLFAIRERDVRWVRRLLARFPHLATSTDGEGQPLAQHARDCGSQEIARLLEPAPPRTRAPAHVSTRAPAMTRYVAFLRAINVAGHARISMTDLRDGFASAGCRNVRTVIQSGNVVFDLPGRDLAGTLRKVQAALGAALGSEATIVTRTLREIDALIARRPFEGHATGSAVKLSIVFLARAPRRRPAFPIVSSKEAVAAVEMIGRDVLVVSRRKPNGFFGFPNAVVERALGVPATSRNWTTVTRIAKRGRAGVDAERG